MMTTTELLSQEPTEANLEAARQLLLGCTTTTVALVAIAAALRNECNDDESADMLISFVRQYAEREAEMM